MCTERILVMEFCDGVHVNQVNEIQKMGINKGKLSEEITKIFDKMIFEDGFVHCDPHPGNLLVRTRRPTSTADSLFMRFKRSIGEHHHSLHSSIKSNIVYKQDGINPNHLKLLF